MDSRFSIQETIRSRGIMFGLRMIVITSQDSCDKTGPFVKIHWSLTKQHALVNGEMNSTVVHKFIMDTILLVKEIV